MKSLVVSDLKKSFGETPILKGINLEMNEGDFWALMGASGSGKSTLLNIIGALIDASSGKITIDNNPLHDLNDNELTQMRRDHIGWVFQDFLLIPELTAKENVQIALDLAGKKGEEFENKAISLLKLVGLEERIDHFPEQLSGGQQQRVALARALVNDPTIILADEPTGNLDTKTGEKIISIFKDLASDGKIVLMVTHDVKLAHAANKVFVLKNGQINEEIEGKEEII